MSTPYVSLPYLDWYSCNYVWLVITVGARCRWM